MYGKVSDSEKPVLYEIARSEKEITMSQIAKNINIKPTPVSTFLKRLVDKNCIIKIKRGEYRIFHKMFREYLLKKSETE